MNYKPDPLARLSRGKARDLNNNNWYDLIENDDKYADCKEYIMLPACGGGCPKHWIDGNDMPCPSYKINLKEKLLLFYRTYFKNNDSYVNQNFSVYA